MSSFLPRCLFINRNVFKMRKRPWLQFQASSERRRRTSAVSAHKYGVTKRQLTVYWQNYLPDELPGNQKQADRKCVAIITKLIFMDKHPFIPSRYKERGESTQQSLYSNSWPSCWESQRSSIRCHWFRTAHCMLFLIFYIFIEWFPWQHSSAIIRIAKMAHIPHPCS